MNILYRETRYALPTICPGISSPVGAQILLGRAVSSAPYDWLAALRPDLVALGPLMWSVDAIPPEVQLSAEKNLLLHNL